MVADVLIGLVGGMGALGLAALAGFWAGGRRAGGVGMGETPHDPARTRFEKAISVNPVVLFSLDRSLTYTWVHNNQVGADDQSAVGRNPHDFFEDASAQALRAFFSQVMDEGQVLRTTLALTPRGLDRVKHFASAARPLVEAGGEVVGLTGASIDITEWVEQHERALADLRRERTALDRATLEFGTSETTAKVVHELRHPLACVITYLDGLLEMAAEDDLNRPEMTRVLARSVWEARRANDILATMQRSAGRPRGAAEEVSLPVLAADLTPPLQQICGDLGVELKVLWPTRPLLVRGEVVGLQQVIVNLIRNSAEAIHLSSQGMQVCLELCQEENHALIKVWDDGPGFPAAVLERGHALFLSSKPGGQGVGLLITRRVLELHNGALLLQNRPEGGALAVVRLPVLMGIT